MTQSGRLRWPLWLALFAGAAWLALFGDKTPAGIASPMQAAAGPAMPLPAPTKRESTTSPTSTPAEPLEALVPRSELIAAGSPAGRDLFAATNWSPPPSPPPPLAAASPAPIAVAPPFTVVGKKLEAGQWEVYLMQGDQSFIAREGSTIDGSYRVEKIAPPNLTMRPIREGQAMTLFVGDAQ